MYLVQVYTGDGKGKTTAALGLALRAAGWGLRTLIVQFMKEWKYGEVKFIEKCKLIKIVQYGCKEFIRMGEKPPQLIQKIKEGLEYADSEIQRGVWNIVILDEIITAVHFNLISESDVIHFINRNKGKCEIILTGRYASKNIIEVADLVTEMRNIKHPYDRGVMARKGIEY